ncbi:hypothetical protein HD806DRAFT_273272 [Xylariaceae sp. AK1471]|nr:hypothetical protein HD806DRAFT_273272 [Xylariaceae sp. AK1471]
MSGMTSTGRGGAGNIAEATKSPRIAPSDLETPHLKTSVVTTGRGGSGNMAHNVDPIETRALQDVGPIERRPSTGVTHVGRGGAANVAKPKSPEPKFSLSEETAVTDDAAIAGKTQQHGKIACDREKDKERERGLAAKARDFFRLT